jgi:hypothetical protein
LPDDDGAVKRDAATSQPGVIDAAVADDDQQRLNYGAI